MSKQKETAKARSMASDTTPGDRKILLVKKLRQMGATSATAARPISEIAEKLGYTPFDVYGLFSGTSGKAGSNPRCLLATGHAKVASIEGAKGGVGFYLTAKGSKTSFQEAPFIREVKAVKTPPKADKVEKKSKKKAAKSPESASAAS